MTPLPSVDSPRTPMPFWQWIPLTPASLGSLVAPTTAGCCVRKSALQRSTKVFSDPLVNGDDMEAPYWILRIRLRVMRTPVSILSAGIHLVGTRHRRQFHRGPFRNEYLHRLAN